MHTGRQPLVGPRQMLPFMQALPLVQAAPVAFEPAGKQPAEVDDAG